MSAKPRTKTKDREKLWDRMQSYRMNKADPLPSKEQMDDLRQFADGLDLHIKSAKLTFPYGFIEIYASKSVNAILLESTQSFAGAASFLLGFQAALDLQRWRGKTEEVFGKGGAK
jgi:hypothetical protein